MSKVVKSVGRAISKVVKGTVTAVKKFAKSKVGRVIIAAAAIYFGGAALAGGFGSSAAGGSFLSGMGTGVANAATSLSGAWSAALGGNFSAAGSSLSAGFQGTTTALQAANAGALTAGATQAQMLASQNAGISGATAATNSAAATAFPASAATAGGGSTLALTPQAVAGSKGLIGGLSPMGQYAAISGATQLVGGTLQGYGAQKTQEDQRDYEQELLDAQNKRYADNVNEFGNKARSDAAAIASQSPAPMAPPPPAPSFADRYRQTVPPMGFGNGPAQVGMINRAAASNPMTNNNFPVYNPAYYRG